MRLDKTIISRLENLARLRLDESEKEMFSSDLTRILSMVDKLQELDTAGVAPLASPTEVFSELRSDEAYMQLPRNEALKNAPLHDQYYFQVLKMIE